MQAAAALPQDQRSGKLDELRSTLHGLISSVKEGHNVRPDGTILHPLAQRTVWFDLDPLISAITKCHIDMRAYADDIACSSPLALALPHSSLRPLQRSLWLRDFPYQVWPHRHR